MFETFPAQRYPTKKIIRIWQLTTKKIKTYNLELNHFAIQLNGSDFEVNTDGTDVALSVSIIGETEQKTRFSDARVSNQEEFEKIITKKRRDKKSYKIERSKKTHYSEFIVGCWC